MPSNITIMICRFVKYCFHVFGVYFLIHGISVYAKGADEEVIINLTQDKSFAEQVIVENATYIISSSFDLKGECVELPSNITLRFAGGRLANGAIEKCGLIEIDDDTVIFKNISFSNPVKQSVKLSWFRYSTDADALENAAKFGKVDGTGYWLIDRTVTINNDIEILNGDFTCRYGIYNIVIEPSGIQEIDYKRLIKKGTKAIRIKGVTEEAEAAIVKSSDIYYKTERGDKRNGTRGELMVIKERKRNRVAFDTGTICGYNNDIKISFFKPIKVKLQNCRFHSSYNNSSDKGKVLVNIGKANAEIRDCYFSGCSVGLALTDCFNSHVLNCSFERIFPWALAFTGGTCNSTVMGCTFDTHRHGWTTLGEAGIVKNCSITNNVCHNSMISICPHANAYGIVIENNIVDGSQGGVGSFAPNSIIRNNKISNLNGFPAIYLTEAGGINPTVIGNQIDNCKGYGGAIRNDGVDLEADVCYIPLEFCEIRDNTINDCPDFSGITCDYLKAGNVDVTIENNSIEDVGYTAVLVKSSSAKVVGNTVNGVRRANFTPIIIQSTVKTTKKRNATIEKNTVTKCNSESEIDVTGFDNVDFRLNKSDRQEERVRFDECKRIKRK